MKETKHTPGPWRARRLTVRDDDYGYMPGYVIDGTGWARLADVHCSGDDAVLGDTTRCEANARIIAAAPEMYDLLATIENDAGQVPDWLWGKIQECLAKVRGEDGVAA